MVEEESASLWASKLLGKGEISLKDVLESPNMAFDKWVSLVSTRGHPVDGVYKSTKLKVEMRVRFLKEEEKKRPRILTKKRNECGCKDDHGHGCSYDDYDVFALAVALEAFWKGKKY